MNLSCKLRREVSFILKMVSLRSPNGNVKEVARFLVEYGRDLSWR